MINVRKLRPVHPFPARMAASIPLEKLTGATKPLTVVDPMSGSGTTIFVARALGHRAVGFDTDPLARMIAKVWCGDLNSVKLRAVAKKVWLKADKCWRSLPQCSAYPLEADEITKKFVRYWFDTVNRKQLTVLSRIIANISEEDVRDQLWCAMSRLIVVKSTGVSLAMDVAHSRPHRVYDTAPIRVLDKFLDSIEYIVSAKSSQTLKGTYRIEAGDARQIPMRRRSADLVITSPPYLNAIDYLRGHKLSLVWMGSSVEEIRGLRSSNIGAEVGLLALPAYTRVLQASIPDAKRIGPRFSKMMARYVCDMHAVMRETARILKRNGQAVFVVGDSTIHGSIVHNSVAIRMLAEASGLRVVATSRRRIPARRRYLPPPTIRSAGRSLQARMRTETVMTFMHQ